MSTWRDVPPIDKLRDRVKSLTESFREPDVDWDDVPFAVKKGCLIPAAGGKRADGYAQLKIRYGNKQWSPPRAYEVILFVLTVRRKSLAKMSATCVAAWRAGLLQH
jgi:hypothetical protein